MQIASWNVNSIKARLDVVLAWLKEASPDVVCLQELKCEDAGFPAGPIEELGYTVSVHGQKSYNGVAILSKRRPDEVGRGLPGGDGDSHSRYIEAVIPSDLGPVRVASIYLPNGNPLGTDKFTYKLAWLDRLIAHAATLLKFEEPLVLCGDYNVIPEPADARFPQAWVRDALFQPESRGRYRRLLFGGLTDAVRLHYPEATGPFTFWDYQAGSWQKDNGIRIDHHLLSPQAADRLAGVRIDKHVRGWERPSDHVPVVIELK